METEVKIRRLYFVEGMSIKAIMRQLGLARNTVRRVVRAEAAGRCYKRSIQAKPALGAYEETLCDWLESDWNGPKKLRRTAMKLFSDLKAQGYGGAYDAVQRYVKSWKQLHGSGNKAFVPLAFEPGDAYQFDWSEELVTLGDAKVKVKVAHFRLCHSRAFFVVAYLRESLEMLLDAHNLAFAYFGGLTRRGIYDNMKSAVTKILMGKERQFNPRFLSLMDHYLIEPVACTPASGWEKGQVENQVDTLRDWLFKPRLKFSNLAALNAHLSNRCQQLQQIRAHPQDKCKTLSEHHAIEREQLRPVGATFSAFSERSVRVDSTCLVNIDRNRYSVECGFANQMVNVRIYADRIEVLSQQHLIAQHNRLFGRDKVAFNPLHYLPLLERKPGALRDGAPFKRELLPKAIGKVKDKLLKHKGGDRDCVQILQCIQSSDLETVEVACQLALEAGQVNRDYILNCISRLKQREPTVLIEIPQVLQLQQVPVANCERYNNLLNQGVAHA